MSFTFLSSYFYGVVLLIEKKSVVAKYFKSIGNWGYSCMFIELDSVGNEWIHSFWNVLGKILFYEMFC